MMKDKQRQFKNIKFKIYHGGFFDLGIFITWSEREFSLSIGLTFWSLGIEWLRGSR